MRRVKWLLALLPAALGFGLAALASGGVTGNPILTMRADVAAIASRIGILLSLIAFFLLALQARQQRALEQRAASIQQHSAEERHRFIQRLDHELKNPLTAIRAGLANLAESSANEEWQEVISSVLAQTLRISHLVSDLRKLADLETRALERTQVDMAALLEDIVEMTQERPEVGERRLRLSVPQAPWPLPKVEGDPDLLFLASHNLVDNALKFTEPGDTVEVRAFEDGNEVVIEVADTGAGIPEEEVPLVWEELYRGEGARGVPGSGLGLALVRAIVERHGGRASLRSRAGQGTVFTVRLPVGR